MNVQSLLFHAKINKALKMRKSLQMPGHLFKNPMLLLVLFHLSSSSFSQLRDSTKRVNHFAGAVSLTNNGISLIPTFSLGKPAVIFNMSIGNDKLSFEPELRFSLEGKPWSFIFWWRYKLLNGGRFQLNVGAHPALNFKTVSVPSNEGFKEARVTGRYLAGELFPNFLFSKNISIGIYYLYSHGFNEGATRNTHFLTLNGSFSNIRLSRQFFVRVTPQFYYLKLDKEDGFFFNSSMTLARRNFPISVSAIINKTIHTNIKTNKDFVWNATLAYSFSKKYIKT